MWTLYGSDGSGSAAVQMALLRCALPYRVVRASTWEPDSDQQQLQQASPLGQIPTLQFEAGSVLTLDLLAAVVSRWSGTRAHLAAHRPDLLGVLLHVEQHPDLAPVFARHWPS